jgi:hypothetical protein
MSAKNRPVSKPMNQKFEDNYDRIFGKSVLQKTEVMAAQEEKNLLLRGLVDNIANAPKPIGEDTRPKDRIKRGLGSACVEETWDCTKKGGDV